MDPFLVSKFQQYFANVATPLLQEYLIVFISCYRSDEGPDCLKEFEIERGCSYCFLCRFLYLQIKTQSDPMLTILSVVLYIVTHNLT